MTFEDIILLEKLHAAVAAGEGADISFDITNDVGLPALVEDPNGCMSVFTERVMAQLPCILQELKAARLYSMQVKGHLKGISAYIEDINGADAEYLQVISKEVRRDMSYSLPVFTRNPA